MHVALYARVSPGRQEREPTIASQLSALRTWTAEQGHEVLPDHIYCDEVTFGESALIRGGAPVPASAIDREPPGDPSESSLSQPPTE